MAPVPPVGAVPGIINDSNIMLGKYKMPSCQTFPYFTKACKIRNFCGWHGRNVLLLLVCIKQSSNAEGYCKNTDRA